MPPHQFSSEIHLQSVSEEELTEDEWEGSVPALLPLEAPSCCWLNLSSKRGLHGAASAAGRPNANRQMPLKDLAGGAPLDMIWAAGRRDHQALNSSIGRRYVGHKADSY